MTLSRKFVLILTLSTLGIIVLNIIGIYFSYALHIETYLEETSRTRESVTIDFINNIIEQQALSDIDTIFSDVELEFFDLLEINNGEIPLNREENVSIIVDFLIRSGVDPRYLEEIIPENNLEKIIDSLQDPNSPESKFIVKILQTLLIFNIVVLIVFGSIIWLITKNIIDPIKTVTSRIQQKGLQVNSEDLAYNKNDEIGLLIQSINLLNKKLRVQEGIRNRLLADISHELKTPITSIQCYLEGIADGVIELNSKNLSMITSEMTRLINLVNMIMEFETFENKPLSPTKISTNIYDFLVPLLETQENILKQNLQTVTLEGSKNIEILLDRELFTQLVYNLVGNFIKYAGANTKLSITVTKESIIFSDNGAGVSKKEVPFITEKFYQSKIEKSGNATNRGIGVGLSVVGKIIEAHNWSYKIVSDTEKGFSFTILFHTSHTLHNKK